MADNRHKTTFLVATFVCSYKNTYFKKKMEKENCAASERNFKKIYPRMPRCISGWIGCTRKVIKNVMTLRNKGFLMHTISCSL